MVSPAFPATDCEVVFVLQPYYSKKFTTPTHPYLEIHHGSIPNPSSNNLPDPANHRLLKRMTNWMKFGR